MLDLACVRLPSDRRAHALPDMSGASPGVVRASLRHRDLDERSKHQRSETLEASISRHRYPISCPRFAQCQFLWRVAPTCYRGDMERFARSIFGYHGCTIELATELISGVRPISEWQQSKNSYDWLGNGIYFWEHGPQRALQWARARYGGSAATVGAIIQLARCFDLLDVEFTRELLPAYQLEKEEWEAAGQPPLVNRGSDDDRRGRYLDCAVINRCLRRFPELQAVRGAFLEGEPAFPGGKVFLDSHIQIAVRDPRCIIGIFQPT